MMVSLEKIKEIIDELGAKAEIPAKLLILHIGPSGDGAPYLVATDSTYDYVSSERGVENSREKFENLDDFLYVFFRDICAILSNEFELRNRVGDEDTRRLSFAKRIELLTKINEEWGRRCALELSQFLINAPFE